MRPLKRIQQLPAVLLAFLFSATSLGMPGRGAEPPAVAATNVTALVIIYVQNFYFPGGPMPLSEPESAADQAARLLERFRALGWPVLHVQHLPQDQSKPAPDSGDLPYRIHARVRPVAGEAVLVKHHVNAFRDTGLLDTLRSVNARRLVIAGMQTHQCVEAAARAAADLGFDVLVPQDACATRTLKFNETEVPAAQVHAATLASLQGAYARVLPTEALLAELPSPVPARR